MFLETAWLKTAFCLTTALSFALESPPSWCPWCPSLSSYFLSSLRFMQSQPRAQTTPAGHSWLSCSDFPLLTHLSAYSLLTIISFPTPYQPGFLKVNHIGFLPFTFHSLRPSSYPYLCFFSDSSVSSLSHTIKYEYFQALPLSSKPPLYKLPGLLHPHRPATPKSVSQSWPLSWIPNSHPTSTSHLYLGVS